MRLASIKSSPKLIAGFIAGLVILVLLAVVVINKAADGAAASYTENYANWNSTKKSETLNLSTSLPQDLYTPKNYTSAASLEKQAEGCKQSETILKKLESAQHDIPKLKTIPFGSINNDYHELKQTAEARQKTTEKYMNEAVSTWDQIVTDCQWNVAGNTKLKKIKELSDKSRAYLLKQGESQDGFVCNSPDGCLPAKAEQRNLYVDKKIASQKLKQQFLQKTFGGEECLQTSFGDYCKRIEDKYLKVVIAYIRLQESYRSLDNPARDNLYKAYKSALGNLNKVVLTSFTEQYSDLEPVGGLKEKATSTDIYLKQVTQGRIKQLISRQAEINKLP